MKLSEVLFFAVIAFAAYMLAVGGLASVLGNDYFGTADVTLTKAQVDNEANVLRDKGYAVETWCTPAGYCKFSAFPPIGEYLNLQAPGVTDWAKVETGGAVCDAKGTIGADGYFYSSGAGSTTWIVSANSGKCPSNWNGRAVEYCKVIAPLCNDAETIEVGQPFTGVFQCSGSRVQAIPFCQCYQFTPSQSSQFNPYCSNQPKSVNYYAYAKLGATITPVPSPTPYNPISLPSVSNPLDGLMAWFNSIGAWFKSLLGLR